MAEADPMERSKRELARSIGSVINHCVAVSTLPLPPLPTHGAATALPPALAMLPGLLQRGGSPTPVRFQLSDNILKEAGHGMVMNAARDFSKLDRTMGDTMGMMKQTAEPLLALEEHYDALRTIDMMVPMAIDTVAAATTRWTYTAPSVAEMSLPPPGRSTSQDRLKQAEQTFRMEREQALDAGSPMSTGDEYGSDADGRLHRSDTNSAMDRAEELSRIATEAQRAQLEKDEAQARLEKLESSLSVDDRDAIEQLINDISLGDASEMATLDTLSSPLDDSLDTAHAAMEAEHQQRLQQDPEGRGAGQRYSKEYYAAREAEVVTPQKYSGAYAAALARNKLEAKERGELEVKDAENRQIERMSREAAAKVAAAERKLSENGELEAIEALISGSADTAAGGAGA